MALRAHPRVSARARRRRTASPIQRGRGPRWTFRSRPTRQPAWRRTGWEAVRMGLLAPAVEVLSEWVESDGSVTPAIVRSGNVFATSFSILAFVTRTHTSEPFELGEFRSTPRSVGIEILLLAVLDSMPRAASLPRYRVLPWPFGAEFALNVRHDFDRPLSPGRVSDVLMRHGRAGSSATWYWRAGHLACIRSRPRPVGSAPPGEPGSPTRGQVSPT